MCYVEFVCKMRKKLIILNSCSTRPERSIARCKSDDGICNMKIIRLESKLRLIFWLILEGNLNIKITVIG